MNDAEKHGFLRKSVPAKKLNAVVVLVVDDEKDDALLTVRALTRFEPPIVARAVFSGADLMSYLEGQGPFADRTAYPYPDVLLLDIKMPMMNGLEALEWLRSHPTHRRIPTIVLSGAAQQQQLVTAYELGARSFLKKPFNADEFEETVRTVLRWTDFPRRDGEKQA